MRISDWSSDVCSADLVDPVILARSILGEQHFARAGGRIDPKHVEHGLRAVLPLDIKRAAIGCPVAPGGIDVAVRTIGRASCRERVCRYGWVSVVAVALKKTEKR